MGGDRRSNHRWAPAVVLWHLARGQRGTRFGHIAKIRLAGRHEMVVGLHGPDHFNVLLHFPLHVGN